MRYRLHALPTILHLDPHTFVSVFLLVFVSVFVFCAFAHYFLIAPLEALYAMGRDGIYFGCWCHHHPKDYFVASIDSRVNHGKNEKYLLWCSCKCCGIHHKASIMRRSDPCHLLVAYVSEFSILTTLNLGTNISGWLSRLSDWMKLISMLTCLSLNKNSPIQTFANTICDVKNVCRILRENAFFFANSNRC